LKNAAPDAAFVTEKNELVRFDEKERKERIDRAEKARKAYCLDE